MWLQRPLSGYFRTNVQLTPVLGIERILFSTDYAYRFEPCGAGPKDTARANRERMCAAIRRRARSRPFDGDARPVAGHWRRFSGLAAGLFADGASPVRDPERGAARPMNFGSDGSWCGGDLSTGMANHRGPCRLRGHSPSGRQFTRNRATYVSEALVLAVQGEQLVLRTKTAVHVPERIMRQSASRIAHECFRLNYQVPPALACRRSNVDAA